MDIYVAPSGEDLGKPAAAISRRSSRTPNFPPNIRVNMRGLVVTMQNSFRSFGIGLVLAILLVYLILVAQFASFIDPFLIVLAVPTGLVGVILTLVFTGTTLNIQSLMGIVMLQGMVVSNSILIVDFANVLRSEGHSVVEAVAHACRIRLRPILMTSLATVVGLLPMAFKLETGQRSLCAAGSRDHRRPDLFHPADDLCGARGVPADLPAPRSSERRSRGRGGALMRLACRLPFSCFARGAFLAGGSHCAAQTSSPYRGFLQAMQSLAAATPPSPRSD